jgi:hypothetical protein
MNKGSIRQRKSKVAFGIRGTISLVLLISSTLKSVNIHSFALETRMYVDAYMAGWLHSLATTGAIAVCAIEMQIALLAMRKEYRRIAAMGFFLLLSFFVYLTGINLFFPSIIGSIESCGCFGELIHFTPIESFVKSVVLWLLSLVLMINSYREHEPWNITKLIKDRYMYICIAVSMVLPFYSLWFFDGWNHTIYVVGFIVLCIVILLVLIMSLRQSLQTKETHETERVVEFG